MITETALYLGPAKVVSTDCKAGFVGVQMGNSESVKARIAIPIPYSPIPGDELLVICQAPSDPYIIGVLKGKGTTKLQVPGDLVLQAAHGSIRLEANKSVDIRSANSISFSSKKATFRVDRLNIFATTVVQHISYAYNWVTELLQFKARRSRTVVSEGWLVRTNRAHIKSTGNTCINGKTIHLG